MDMGLFEKVIGELAELNYDGRVAFHVNNEPLIVPNLEQYISAARAQLPHAWIQILTNGRSLSISRAASLLSVGVNEISINHYNDEDYLSGRVPEKFDEIRDQVIRQYYPHDAIIGGHGPPANKKDLIFRYNVFLRRETEVMSNRAGTAPNNPGLTGHNVLGFCEYPFTQLNITADGTVSQCCADLYFRNAMGNVRDMTVLDIWYGSAFRKARRALLANDRNGNFLCKSCDFLGVKSKYSRFFWHA